MKETSTMSLPHPADTARRTKGVTEAAKGAVAAAGRVSAMSEGAANTKQKVKGAAAGRSARAPLGGGALGTMRPTQTVQVSKRVVGLVSLLASGHPIQIEGTASLGHWQGQQIPEGCAFIAKSGKTGAGLAFLSLQEKEQFDLLLEAEGKKLDAAQRVPTQGKGVAA